MSMTTRYCNRCGEMVTPDDGPVHRCGSALDRLVSDLAGRRMATNRALLLEAITKALEMHQVIYQSDGDFGERQWIECSCSSAERDCWTGETEADHREHLARALTATARIYGGVV